MDLKTRFPNAWISRMAGIGLLLFVVLSVKGQSVANVSGRVTNSRGIPIELVNVALTGIPGGTVTDRYGKYVIQVPAGKNVEIAASFIGFKTFRDTLLLRPGQSFHLDIMLETETTDLSMVMVEDKMVRTTSFMRIDPKSVTMIPTMGGGVESIIKTLPGVSSNNELSSQYSVRGGNYDENLVYVNDIEIYRPFLVRSGQQEGLSFLNPDLVSSILFSAGGFEARYGDKMSSVLDIQYKKPAQFAGSASLSLLGGSLHLEGISGNRKTTYLLGLRQKSNQYVLGSLQTKGDYQPSFTDVQALVSHSWSPKWEISAFGNLSLNLFRLVPHDRETSFGTIQEAYRLRIYFEGQEDDQFVNGMGAITLAYKPSDRLRLKLITSAFRSVESETYDVLGQYWIGQLESDQSGDELGKVVEERGVGSYLNHARNRLEATVATFEHKGTYLLANDNYLQWGIKVQHEAINDQINEWILLDSAGFTLPVTRDSVGFTHPSLQPPRPLLMDERVKASHETRSNRLSGYIQKAWAFAPRNTKYYLTAGIRSQYWDLNRQVLLSPRMTLSLKPNWERDVLFRFSAGYYYQPPFYRELRDRNGALNPDLKAQTSVHFLAAGDYNFKAWNRPFKFVAEAYYKYLDNLVPYDIDNVRIRYDARNNAHGFAAGLDLKVNGEFVKGVESWASLSLMKTMEDIEDDFYWEYYNAEGKLIIPGYTSDIIPVDSLRIEPGLLRRPSDQRVSFSLFFQDYLPNNPTYKMHLNLVFGTGLPYGAPKAPKYQHIYRTPPYRRVDIGFSKMIKSEGSDAGGIWKHFKSIWITAEVFNLLQFSNTISYVWVTDVNGRRYAVPNYLTPRQVNVKLMVTF